MIRKRKYRKMEKRINTFWKEDKIEKIWQKMKKN